MNHRRRLLCLAAMVLAFGALACGSGSDSGVPPESTEDATEEPSPPALLPTATPATGPIVPPPEIEERIVETEWPASMRTGDSDVIRLSLIPGSESDYTPRPDIADHEVEPSPLPLAVSRPGYTAYVVASLSAAGLEVEPASPARQRLVAGQANTWRWTVYPAEAGTYRAVASLSVEWEPDEGSGLPGPFEDPVWSRTLTVEAHSVLRLSGKQTDWIGLTTSAVGFIAGLPFSKKLFDTLRVQSGRRRKTTRG